MMTPRSAKKFGRKVELRPDWEEVKDQIMEEIVYAKFSQNKYILRKLIATKDEMIIEKNDWGDTYWGVCKFKEVGENKLGKILMKIRKQFQEEKAIYGEF